MVFNATFNNISAISWRSVLLVEETRVRRENHRPPSGIQNHNTNGAKLFACTSIITVLNWPFQTDNMLNCSQLQVVNFLSVQLLHNI